MRIWDCHCHLDDESPEEVLRATDEAGLERINLFSRYPEDEGPAGPDRALEVIEGVARVQAAAPDRVFGLFWANARVPGIVELIEYAIVDRGLRGIKMIPDHWSPADELLFPIYEKMQELGCPIQFHSGILYGFGDSSRFCRPALYEALLNFPRVRFSLAHIAWPWVDECIAVYGRFRAGISETGQPNQMWIDTSRGTPDAWRLEALAKAIPFCDSERLMFGVDCSPSGLPGTAPVHAAKDLAILRDVIGVSQQQIEMYFWGACEAFWAE